jgi:glycine/D-amino acid oxidase-like deaminating enzyme
MAQGLRVIATDARAPQHSDVVVIGAGIVGLASALALAERGLSVTVLEKGHVAGEQSSRNWGWVRQALRDPRELELARRSLELWRGLNARVGAETGFRTTGIVFAAADEASAEDHRRWIRTARDAGIVAELVSGAALAQLLPGDAAPPPAALYCASDGCAEPALAAPAIAEAARRLGAVIVQGCAVRAVELAAGAIDSVETEHGRVRCASVVVAAGAWSRRILAELGLRFPQLRVRSSVARTEPVAGGPGPSFWDEDFAIRRRADGGYTVAPGAVSVVPLTPDVLCFARDFLPALRLEWRSLDLRLDGRFLAEWREARPTPPGAPSRYERVRVLAPEPDSALIAGALTRLAVRFPAFAGARFVERWAGYIDVTPDALPVLSPVEEVPGLVLASGFSGHGFGVAPAAGELVAELVAGLRPSCDRRPYRWSRLRDGSRHEPFGSI